MPALPNGPCDCAVLAAPQQEPVAEKIAPVQGYTPGIPWSLHLEAYDAYRKKYGRQDALIDLEGRNCRGGFGMCELDVFIPGWRDRVSEITQLKSEIVKLRAAATQKPKPAAPVLSDDLIQLLKDAKECITFCGVDPVFLSVVTRIDALLAKVRP
jgi:hypothetical protein